ncbi:MAG: FAD:protein FMN transferase [Candidatus Omnitrophota bacterium]|jgi:thiamine biosynthesis lipoprotein
MPKKIIISTVVIALAVTLLITLQAPDDQETMIFRTRLLMNTVCEIKAPLIEGAGDKALEDAIEAAFAEIERIEGVFSAFKDGSEISRLNGMKPREPLKVSDEAFALIEKAVRFNKLTNGAFDITVKPLVDAWKREGSKTRIVTYDELKALLPRVGSSKLILDKDNKTVAFANEGMSLDMGGIAKGYAAGRAAETLKARGVENAIVNLGGSMYCLGSRSKKLPWRVGIQHPRKKDKVLLELDLSDMAINTSGDYERYFLVNGRRYSHIIDPRNGLPIGDDIISASVIAKDPAVSDILATALCVLGVDGLPLVSSIDGADAIMMLNKEGAIKIEMTHGIKGRHVITEKK